VSLEIQDTKRWADVDSCRRIVNFLRIVAYHSMRSLISNTRSERLSSQTPRCLLHSLP
jgi:hypothetical protein